MHIQRGTTLSELLISMTLFLFLMMVVSRFMFSIHKNGAQLQSSLSATQTFFAAIKFLERDIRSANHTIDSWDLSLPNPVWLVNNVHIKWYVTSGSLIRRTGTYSTSAQEWKKHTDSLVAHNVEIFALEPHQNNKNQIHTVSYKIGMKSYERDGIISIKNRDIS